MTDDDLIQIEKEAQAHLGEGPPYVKHLYGVVNSTRALVAEVRRLRERAEQMTDERGQAVLDLDEAISERDIAEAALERIRALVDEQAEEPGLWDIADGVVEAFLQQELRRLHAEIEKP